MDDRSDSGYYINSKDDIFFFFEIIRQLNASFVLDYGMFLKRCGAISRRIGDMEIPEDVTLDAMDLNPGLKLPVYETVYNDIFTDLGTEKTYSLSMVFPYGKIDVSDTLKRLSAISCNIALPLGEGVDFESLRLFGNTQDFFVGKKHYALVQRSM